METAHALGISHRRFQGWEPVETTRVVEWDDEGRPAAWVTTREPEWDDDERDIMLALHGLRRAQCPRGHALEFMTDQSPSELLESDASLPGMQVQDVWCFACRAEDLHSKAHEQLDKGLADTPLDEAPGRYSITRKLPDS